VKDWTQIVIRWPAAQIFGPYLGNERAKYVRQNLLKSRGSIHLAVQLEEEVHACEFDHHLTKKEQSRYLSQNHNLAIKQSKVAAI
jgi:hypothetical protein